MRTVVRSVIAMPRAQRLGAEEQMFDAMRSARQRFGQRFAV